MKALFFDAFSGISGDMSVGALLALGLPLERLREQLEHLPLHGYEISAATKFVNGIAATKFDVHIADDHDHSTAEAHHHHHRAFRDIHEMLRASALDAVVRDTAIAIFTVLAKAEGKVHGVAPDAVTFHEVGAVDSIVDIVATAVGVQHFAIERAYVGPLPLGSGVIRSQHGPIPVPGPATAELLKGFTTRAGDGVGELVTPTGAAIIAALASPGAPPELRIEAVGYGAGTRVLEDRPNVLRLVLAEVGGALHSEEMLVVETNIDDMNPEIYDYVMERLFTAGARDVYLTPIHMKKNRPGVVLSALCTEAERDAISGIILRETSAIGLRYYAVRRSVLQREIIEVATSYGMVKVKMSLAPDGQRNVAPEYEDCQRLARTHGVPLKIIYQEAITAALFAP